MSDIMLTTSEKFMLIAGLCDQLKWMKDYMGTKQNDMVKVADRLAEVVRSLPYDLDADTP